MSDPMTNVEIEDVLSSIRRLVSEDLRGPDRSPEGIQGVEQGAVLQSIGIKRPAAAAQAKLVLTPALRVAPVPDEPTANPKPDEARGDLWAADAMADAAMAPTAEAVVDLEDAGSLDAQLPDATGVPGARASGEWRGTLYGAALAAAARGDDGADDPEDSTDPATLEATIAELEAAVAGIDDGFEPDGVDADSNYAGAAMDFGDEALNDASLTATRRHMQVEPDIRAEVAADTGSAGSPVPADGPPVAVDAMVPAPADEEIAELYVIGGYEAGPDETVGDGSDDEREPDDKALAMPVSGFAMDLRTADAAEAGDTADGSGRPGGLRRLTLAIPADGADAVADTEKAAGTIFGGAADPIRSPRIIRPAEFAHDRAAEGMVFTTAAPDDDKDGEGLFRHGAAAANLRPVTVARPEAGPATAGDAEADVFDAADDIVIDADALRDLVAEIIREELQGALGERITRNVRKLVRREIARALETRDLE